MNEALLKAVTELESHLPELERQRLLDPFANDLYEAAYYWCELGHWVLEDNRRVNYPERVRGETDLLIKLRSILEGKSADEQKSYLPLLNTGGEILSHVGRVRLPEDGYLGFLRIIRECFGFLQTEYGFSITDEQPTQLRFSSGAVYVKLEHSRDPWLSCLFGPESSEPNRFSIYDLLFLSRDGRYRTLPERLTLTTANETDRWFKFVAEMFEQYGQAVLRNEPGIFERLAKAQSERDEEYRREMDKRHQE
ncbi:MAG TPA: hypothetical protein VK473_01155 [Terriglobales bacterium]|nr:hypothetical protein [Terriglobales bacterium]